ncbi:RNI-like protein [Sodiomyces alkalinus F11]|uniref:RNI-like protein n=1 Tax=Sodiomyces alkalinus (strain CBS 110278 / VKM F-3762 / F11) TaxID=1314773 RepID=A0A3N2PVL0_SODAK|nr:RNI-like protein [Sodiomyces alkalinus F11]ROT38518.1 RNI-like protein [Sodiomyces alkalinus F11]
MESVVTFRPALPPLQTNVHRRDGSLGSPLELDLPTSPTATRKRASFISKKIRSFSISSRSSFDLSDNGDSRSGANTPPPRRVLQKTPTMNSSSIFRRISRRASKDSMASSQTSDESVKFASMTVLKHGPLKIDARLRKARADYLVLTDACLLVFSTVDAARSIFPTIGGAPPNRLSRSSTVSSLNHEAGPSEKRVEIPLGRIIEISNDEGLSPHFALDVWWSEAPPTVAWAHVKLLFGLPQERDLWMSDIRRAVRELLGTSSVPVGLIAPNVESRIRQIVAEEEPGYYGGPLGIFPVVQTLPSRANTESYDFGKKWRDAPSYYLLLGINMCYLVCVPKTSVHKLPEDLDMTYVAFGLTSLIRFRATLISHDDRFALGFRMPGESEKRLELASRWYREIVATFMKADRIVKPAWPQHLQHDIFKVQGLTPQLYLPLGEDFGGFRRTLEAYCATYGCESPEWTVSWKCQKQEYNPEFRLVRPRVAGGYTRFQLLAVFKALRYNDYFQSLSFRGVDFRPLCGWFDSPRFSDSVADVSRNGLVIDSVHRDILKAAPILSREIHAMAFSSGSIRKIDLTDVLSSWCDPSNVRSGVSIEQEIARPLFLLLKTRNTPLDTLLLGGNPLTTAEVDDLVSALAIPGTISHLDISRCRLDESSLEDIWDALQHQGLSMEVLNTSHNSGSIDYSVVRDSLVHFTSLRSLKIAGNCLGRYTDFLFYDETTTKWSLEELDLSDVRLSEETIRVLATYLSSPASQNLKSLHLNNCGINGSDVAMLFRSMGQNRELVCYVSGNPMETGGNDLASAVACNFGPKALFMDMIEYRDEVDFIKMIRALAVNKTISLLSLVGTATPGQVSEEACAAVSDLFATNTALRCLDFSGYSAKLDEGQLGLGFSRALAGLAQNRSLRHLRIRNQKLNMNVGDLASAISTNATLRTLDVHDNGFNLSNLTHMTRSLERNTSIHEFLPFSQHELDRAIRTSMESVEVATVKPGLRRRLSSKHAARPAGLGNDERMMLLQELRGAWTAKLDQIERILERNRVAAAAAKKALPRSSLGTGHGYGYGYGYGYGSHGIIDDLPTLFGGLATVDRGKKQAQTTEAAADSRKETEEGEEMTRPWTPPPPAESVGTAQGDSIGTAPHHVSGDKVLDSPVIDVTDLFSSLYTPPEWAVSDESP